MNQRLYIIISGIFFCAIAIIHLVRAVSGWPLIIGSVDISMAFSWIAFLFTGFLSYTAFRLVGKKD